MPLEIGEIPGGGRPFGDIYDVETPALDRITQQLQQQRAARQAYEQKESQNTDELLNKEMANVRSIDTPQVIDAYSNYKQLKKRVLFDKSLQNNPKAYNAANMEANAAYANAMSLINKSTQYNQLGKQFAANRLAKPDAFDDKAGEMQSLYYNTPMDKLTQADYNGQKVDLTNPDVYRYKAGNADFQKIQQAAVGKPVTHYDNGQTDESGIQTTQHGYSYGNTPGQYRNVYLSGLAGNQANRGARYNWSQKSQQDLDSLDAAYQNSPNWQKLGMQPQQLPPYNPNDPVGNEATFQAKQYLVNMNPAEVKASTVTNQGAKMNKQLSNQEIMEAMKENNREKLKTLGHAFRQMDIKQQSTVLDDTYNTMVDQAKQGNRFVYKSADGTVSKAYEIPASPALKKEFSVPDDKGHPIYPDAFQISEDGTSVRPIFYRPGEAAKTGGTKAIDQTVSKPMSAVEFKARLGKGLFGTREAAKESGTPEIKITESTGKKTINGF